MDAAGTPCSARLCGAGALAGGASASLGLTHRPAVGERGTSEVPAVGVVGREQQRAPVALGEVAPLDEGDGLVGQVEQAGQVGDGDAGAADPEADLLAREPELLDEGGARPRLLDGVEVLARHVLDQGELERHSVVVRAHDRGEVVHPRELRRPPAALAGDQLVPTARDRAHEDRLQDAVGSNRVGKRDQPLLVEGLPRLVGVRVDQVDRQRPKLLVGLAGSRGEDRRQSASHSSFLRHLRFLLRRVRTVAGKDAGSVASSARERPRTQPCDVSDPSQPRAATSLASSK